MRRTLTLANWPTAGSGRAVGRRRRHAGHDAARHWALMEKDGRAVLHPVPVGTHRRERQHDRRQLHVCLEELQQRAHVGAAVPVAVREGEEGQEGPDQRPLARLSPLDVSLQVYCPTNQLYTCRTVPASAQRLAAALTSMRERRTFPAMSRGRAERWRRIRVSQRRGACLARVEVSMAVGKKGRGGRGREEEGKRRGEENWQAPLALVLSFIRSLSATTT